MIEKARECGWDEFEAGELADFALPLLAQAREEAIEEVAAMAEECDAWIDAGLIRGMLRRAPGETEHAGVAQVRPSSFGNRDTPDEGASATEQAVTSRKDAGSSPAPGPNPAWADAIAREIAVLRLRLIVEPTDIAALLTERFGPVVEALERSCASSDWGGIKTSVLRALIARARRCAELERALHDVEEHECLHCRAQEIATCAVEGRSWEKWNEWSGT